MKGPWYQHVFASLGLLIYIAIVLFFVSSDLCCGAFLFLVCLLVCLFVCVRVCVCLVYMCNLTRSRPNENYLSLLV